MRQNKPDNRNQDRGHDQAPTLVAREQVRVTEEEILADLLYPASESGVMAVRRKARR